MGWLNTGIPSSVRSRTAEYRVDAAGGGGLRTFGLVASAGMAVLTVLTMPKHWPNVVSMAPAMGFLAVLVGVMLWLSRSRAARSQEVRLMAEAALGGTWVQARVLEVRASYFGRVKGRWSFRRMHLRLRFTDPKTGQSRDQHNDLFVHPDEQLASGQVIWVRCHPSLPEPIFVPVQG